MVKNCVWLLFYQCLVSAKLLALRLAATVLSLVVSRLDSTSIIISQEGFFFFIYLIFLASMLARLSCNTPDIYSALLGKKFANSDPKYFSLDSIGILD